ncbi:hypothetical protein [Methylotenera sp.]|uniref:hypothetical protein n=1 Tax=Methylotenera sp. TaxID=2051956 RepID=UPI00248935DC|nr:hypothetical protein [Methylotenera sp.]MDI1298612.1 hypothetical protein [Methylotenera sp.]
MLKYICVGIFLLGFVGQYWVGSRSFNRTNAMGVQEFNSYFGAVFWRLFEFVVGLSSTLAILFGFLGFCIAYGLGR